MPVWRKGVRAVASGGVHVREAAHPRLKKKDAYGQKEEQEEGS
jgi:hypothetical protein